MARVEIRTSRLDDTKSLSSLLGKVEAKLITFSLEMLSLSILLDIIKLKSASCQS